MGLAIQLLLLTAILATSHGLRCYVGPEASKTATTCPSSSTQCHSYESGGAKSFLCGPNTLPTGCNEQNGVKTCVCDYDLCILENTNSGSGIDCYKNNINEELDAVPTTPTPGSCGNSDIKQCMIITKEDRKYYDCGPTKDKGFVKGCIPHPELPDVQVCICDGALCNFVGAKLDSAASKSQLGLMIFTATLIAILYV